MVKTALKLLLVFVEYSESNAPLLIEAITTVDNKRGKEICPIKLCFFFFFNSPDLVMSTSSSPGGKPWSNTMEILQEKDGVDTELLVYAMTLINKVLDSSCLYAKAFPAYI